MDKCKEKPKLFFRYVNSKMKNRERISRLKMNGQMCEDPAELAKIMNRSFQSVFTKERRFVWQSEMSEEMGLGEIQVTEEDVQKQMEGLDVRKAPGPDGVSGWILKECNQQLTWVIHNIIESSLIESRVPIEWKRANIVPIYKGGSKEERANLQRW